MKTVTLCILALFPAGIAVADEAEHREHPTAIELVD
jgi:hypothetical protein